MARTLVNGEVRGFRWFELPRSAAGSVEGFHGDASAQTVTILVHPDEYPSERRIEEYFNPKFASMFLDSIAFQPIDVDVELPGRLVGYASITGGSVRAWLEANVPAPGDIQVDYDYPDYAWRRKLVAVATTEKDGRIVKVRKTVDPALPIDESLAKVFRSFQRSAPRPRADATTESCSAYVAAILGRATAGAVRMVEAWRRVNAGDRDNLVIDGLMLPGTGVERLTLKTTRTSNAILTEAVLKGGHTIDEDRSGIAIRMMAGAPDTLVNGLSGESFARVLDTEWAGEIAIRSASTAASDAFDIRGTSRGVPFAMPEPIEMDEAEATSLMRRIASSGVFRAIDAATLEKLRAMTPQDAASTLLAIRQHEYYDLAGHGHPGWWVSNQGGYVTLNRSPMTSDDALAQTISGMFG